MTFLQTLLITAIPAIITGCIAIKVSRKSQINANTDAIEKLSEKLNNQYMDISKDIGRQDDLSLTRQHASISSCIERNFGAISKRYEAEDNAYKLFTSQQLDLKHTLDNFSRDYVELKEKQLQLCNENDKLRKKNEELLEENKQLRSKLSKNRSKDKPERGR